MISGIQQSIYHIQLKKIRIKMILKYLMRLRKSFSRGRLIANKRHISQLVIRLAFLPSMDRKIMYWLMI